MSHRCVETEDRKWLFDKVLIERRGKYWHFRMWLDKEDACIRKSLKTTNLETAKNRAEELYIEVRADQKMGKRHFSVTAAEGVKLYLAEKQKEVELGTIKSGRLGTIKTHLAHWENFIGAKTKLKELDRDASKDYSLSRRRSNISLTTIVNEQSTINAMMGFLFRQNEAQVEAFDFPKLSGYVIDNERIRRETLTNDEYNALTKTMRGYVDREKHNLDDREHFTREMMRHYVLIASNSGLRTGEQQQLRWCDVKIRKHDKGSTMQNSLLIEIHVRAETSKVGKGRKIICRGGLYLQRWKEISRPKHDTDLIFSFDGTTKLTNRLVIYHFHRMVELAGVKDHRARKIVPYSLRHFMVTQRVMSGLSLQQVAEMCGTSDNEVRKTYYHLFEDRMLTNAVADYRIKADGTIETI